MRKMDWEGGEAVEVLLGCAGRANVSVDRHWLGSVTYILEMLLERLSAGALESSHQIECSSQRWVLTI